MQISWLDDDKLIDPAQIRLVPWEAGVRLMAPDRCYLSVKAVRAFPLSEPSRYFVLLDGANQEIGVISNPRELDAESRRLVERMIRRGTPSQMSVWASTDVDLVGSVQLQYGNGIGVVPVPAHIEVKSVISKNWSLSGLSDKEHGYLSDALSKRHAAWLALAWYIRYNTCNICGHVWAQHPPHKCPRCYSAAFSSRFSLDTLHLVRYREWNELLSKLRSRSETDARFGGKSIRRHTDWDLLTHCQIDKSNGRWQLPPHHWLVPLLPNPNTLQHILPI